MQAQSPLVLSQTSPLLSIGRSRIYWTKTEGEPGERGATSLSERVERVDRRGHIQGFTPPLKKRRFDMEDMITFPPNILTVDGEVTIGHVGGLQDISRIKSRAHRIQG